MMNKKIYKIKWLVAFSFLLFFSISCTRKNSELDKLNISSFEKIKKKSFVISGEKVHRKLLNLCVQRSSHTAIDFALYHFYSKEESSLWLTSFGDWKRIELILPFFENSYAHGLNPEKFFVSNIKRNYTKLRSLNIGKGDDINKIIAELEYDLSAAYLKYVCGMNYGFVNPHKILNNIDEAELKPGEVRDSLAPPKMKVYYSTSLKRANKVFLERAIEAIKGNFLAFLIEVQPKDPFYTQMQKEYLKLCAQKTSSAYVMQNGDNHSVKYYKDCLAVNMERMRWRKKLEKGHKYVIVNIPSFMLEAVNDKTDSVLRMKICCGSYENKTPLLSSKIAYMQMNPYWNVPKSIVRKEIIPSYLKDPAYFEKHQMKVYDKEGNEVNPIMIKWADYDNEDLPFNVKQEKGEGNSLGRLIFRFPNPFAVYLHDTPSRWAFISSNRAVSHGCVRLEKPLDFAFFLLKKKDEKIMDKIRIAIDLPPKTKKGKDMLESPDFKPIKVMAFPEMIPLFIDYYTVSTSTNGTLNYYEDIYRFDKPLLEKLRKI